SISLLLDVGVVHEKATTQREKQAGWAAMLAEMRMSGRPDQHIGLTVECKKAEPITNDRDQAARLGAIGGAHRPGIIRLRADPEFVPGVTALERAEPAIALRLPGQFGKHR